MSALSEPFGALLVFLFFKNILNSFILGILYSIVAGIMINISLNELISESLSYKKYKNTFIFTLFGVVSTFILLNIFN